MRYTHKITRAWDATLPPPDGRKVQVGLWVDATNYRNVFNLIAHRFLAELTAAELAQGPPEGMGHVDGPRPDRSRPAAPPEPPAPPAEQRPATLPTPPPQPEDAKPAVQPTPTESRDDVEERRRQPVGAQPQPGSRASRRLPE